MSTKSNNLKKELDYYIANQDELVKKYLDKYLIIKDEVVVGVYDSELEAYNDGKKKFDLGTFLIQKCVPGTDSYTQVFHSRAIFN